MKPFRLNSYKKYIVNFDSLDRNFSLVEPTKLEKTVIQINNCSILSKLQNLTLSLTLEIFTHQRVLQKVPKSNCLKVSINKRKLLTLLDIYLASIFLVKMKKLNFSYDKLINKMDLFISNQVISNLNLSNLNKSSVQLNQNTKRLLAKPY